MMSRLRKGRKPNVNIKPKEIQDHSLVRRATNGDYRWLVSELLAELERRNLLQRFDRSMAFSSTSVVSRVSVFEEGMECNWT